LRAQGYQQSPSTGTFFNPDLDLSFKITEAGCSIVAGGDDLGERDLALLAASDPKRLTRTRPISKFRGRNYISAIMAR
jgi:hypothetical protein